MTFTKEEYDRLVLLLHKLIDLDYLDQNEGLGLTDVESELLNEAYIYGEDLVYSQLEMQDDELTPESMVDLDSWD